MRHYTCTSVTITYISCFQTIWYTNYDAYQASLQPGRSHLPLVKSRYNQQIYKEVLWKYRYCLHTHTLDTFRRSFQFGEHNLVTVAHPYIAVASLFLSLFVSFFPVFFSFYCFLFLWLWLLRISPFPLFSFSCFLPLFYFYYCFMIIHAPHFSLLLFLFYSVILFLI